MIIESPWRKEFPAFHKKNADGKASFFLDSAASAQKASSVIDAMDIFVKNSYANTHRGVHGLAEAATNAYENARAAVVRFLSISDPANIVFTAGTTASINIAALSLLRSGFIPDGSTIVATTLDHHSNLLPWMQIAEDAKSRNVKFLVAPLNSNAEISLEELEEIFKENKVSVLAITHVSNVTGVILPIKKIIALAHRYGALVLVDGAQSVPHIKVDLGDLRPDFYVFSGHKLYGPTGIGVLYVAESLAKKLKPAFLGGGMVGRVGDSFSSTTWAPLPHLFEAGTPPIIEAVGLHTAINFVDSVGFDKIEMHEEVLFDYLLKRLEEIPEIKIYARPKQKVGVVAFNLSDYHPHDVGSILASMGVAVRVGHHCAQPLMKHFGILGCVRASLGLYNNSADVDALIEGLLLVNKKMGGK
jgi:cysteine desulfurase/selenocysteine lyase